MRPDRLTQLLFLNLALQLFDGVATYQGVRLQMPEGNPLLAASMGQLGVGGALALFKAQACGLLVLLHRLGGRAFAYESLVVVATVYVVFSFVPWMSRLLSLVVA